LCANSLKRVDIKNFFFLSTLGLERQGNYKEFLFCLFFSDLILQSIN